MTLVPDRLIYDAESVALMVLLGGFTLALLLHATGARRPGLDIRVPIASAFAIRILAAAAVSLTSVGATLRGGDELAFLGFSRKIAEAGVLSGQWLDVLTSRMHMFVLVVQFRVLDPPELALRVTQAAISVAGLALLVCAVYDLAGPRAASISAWLLAVEPSNVFFSTIIHKEPLLLLAEGLVAFGGASLWSRGKIVSLTPCALGCLIALATRPYAGFLLIAATAATTLHASFRLLDRSAVRSLPLVAGVIMLAALTAPFVWQSTSQQSLEHLNISQGANATDNSNLKLEQVRYLDRLDLVTRIPGRVRDLLIRPYPWQLANLSQQLGAIGALFALGLLFLLARALWQARGQVLRRAAPLVYVAGFELYAYALSVGNAGTGFRYRMHLVALGICLTMVLRAYRRAPGPSRVRLRRPVSGVPVVSGS